MNDGTQNVKNNVILEKSFNFAVRIVKMIQYLQKGKQEYLLTKQILRSGTSIGALVRESQYAESSKDFIHKLKISLKEANETEYWLLLLREGNYITEQQFQSINPELKEIIKLLVSIVKASKKNNNLDEELEEYEVS